MGNRYDDVNKVWDDRAFKGYADLTDSPVAWIVGAVVVLAAVVLIGWQIGWWFAGQNVNREAHLLRNSYGNQQTLRDEITSNIGNALTISSQIAATSGSEAAALKAQRYAVVNIVCDEAEQVAGDPLDPQQQQFISANCEAGTVKPGSQYAPH